MTSFLKMTTTTDKGCKVPMRLLLGLVLALSGLGASHAQSADLSYLEVGLGQTAFDGQYSGSVVSARASVGVWSIFHIRLEGFAVQDSGDADVVGNEFQRGDLLFGLTMFYNEWLEFTAEAGPIQGSFEDRDGVSFSYTGSKVAGGVRLHRGPWEGTLRAQRTSFNASIFWSGQELDVGYRFAPSWSGHVRADVGGDQEMFRALIRYRF